MNVCLLGRSVVSTNSPWPRYTSTAFTKPGKMTLLKRFHKIGNLITILLISKNCTLNKLTCHLKLIPLLFFFFCINFLFGNIEKKRASKRKYWCLLYSLKKNMQRRHTLPCSTFYFLLRNRMYHLLVKTKKRKKKEKIILVKYMKGGQTI